MIKNPGTNLVVYNNDKTSELIDGTYTGELHIASGATYIRDYACANLTGVTAVTIPNTITQIRSYAFNNCTGLQTVSVEPGTVITSLGTYSFNNCSSLKDVSALVENILTGTQYMLSRITDPTTHLYFKRMTSCSNNLLDHSSNYTCIFGDSITNMQSYAFSYTTGTNNFLW